MVGDILPRISLHELSCMVIDLPGLILEDACPTALPLPDRPEWRSMDKLLSSPRFHNLTRLDLMVTVENEYSSRNPHYKCREILARELLPTVAARGILPLCNRGSKCAYQHR